MTSNRPARYDLLNAHQHLAIRRSGGRIHQAEPQTVHSQAALTLVLAGKGALWCGRTLELTPRDVVFVPMGTPHYVIASSERQTVTLAICPSCMTSQAGDRLLRALEHIFSGVGGKLTLDLDTAAKLQQTLELLDDELHNQHTRVELATEGALSIITALLERAAQARSLGRALCPAPASMTQRVLDYVATHAIAGASLADVAAHVGRSPAHVAATVKAETGRTVLQWITDVRLATACRLLLDTDEAVDVIADRVGYASQSHFHRVFRRLHCMTPGRWRALHREVHEAQPTDERKSS